MPIRILQGWLKLQRSLGPARILVASFASLILVGAILLSLPQATQGPPLGFIDAVFTATSATCVTGLTVVETGSAFSLFGQLVILVLMQLGGLGIMTFSTFVVVLMGRRLGFGSRDIIQETLSQAPMHNLASLLKIVVLATFTIEAIGAAVLAACFLDRLPLTTALYHGVFHAVSAFCNAGFALYADSFIGYQTDLVIIFTLTSLIILGGLGFVVIYEISSRRKARQQSLSLHTRIVLIYSAGLICCGTVLILLLEHRNTLASLPWSSRLLTAYFQSVTARTAGFNTVDIGALSDGVLFLLVILMFIGASPGSTGGGIKTSTFAAVLAIIRARFQNQEEVNLFNRRLSRESVSKAISVTFFSSILIALFLMLLLLSEGKSLSHQVTRGLFLELLFETTSAFGTVGLSTGLTPTLSTAGRFIIILLMFIGRLGPLTVAVAVGGEAHARFKLAEENVLIG